MDIKHFEHVIEVVECSPIDRAAQSLQMLQPSLSVCVKSLEQELGSLTFRRQHGGICLTNKGEPFLKSAREIATKLETIHNIPSMFNHKDNLSISCTYSLDFVNYFPKFKKKKPPIACGDSSKETDLIQTIRDVVEQRHRISLFYYLDAVSDAYYTPVRGHNLKLIPIARNCPLILLASKKNPPSRKKETPFDSITGYKFIIYENFKFDEWPKVLSSKNNNNILYVFDRDGLTDTIHQSRYTTMMMKCFADTYSEGYVEISIMDAPFGVGACYLYYTLYAINSREKQFIRELKEPLADHPANRPI